MYVMDVWYVCCDWIMLKKLTYCEHLSEYIFYKGSFKQNSPYVFASQDPSVFAPYLIQQLVMPLRAAPRPELCPVVLKFPNLFPWGTEWYRTNKLCTLWWTNIAMENEYIMNILPLFMRQMMIDKLWNYGFWCFLVVFVWLSHVVP